MDEIKLRCFSSVARHLSFTKAAEECHVTQSSISKQISALEAELNVKLFIRDRHEVKLTAAGARLAADADDYMAQYQSISESANKLHLELNTDLTIGVGPWEFAILAEPLKIFKERYPNVNINCNLYTHKRMASHFRSGTFDVGVCSCLCTNAVSDLIVQQFVRSDFFVAAPATGNFWAMEKADRAVLKNQTIITLYENEYEPVRPYCVKNNMQHSAFTYSNQFSTLLAMLKSGMGIALVPGFLKPLFSPYVRMENELETPLTIDFVAARNKNVHNTAAENFMAICKELWQKSI